MLPIASVLLTSSLLSAVEQDPTPIQGPAVDPRKEIDAHNYMVVRLRLLQGGEAADQIQTELVSDVRFTGLSLETVALFKRLVTACSSVSSALHEQEEELTMLKQQQDSANIEAVADLVV